MTPAEIIELREFLSGELGKIHKGQDELSGGLAALRGEVGQLRGGVAELHGEVGELRGGVAELRGEVGELRSGLADLAARVDEMREEQDRFQNLVGRHFNDVLSRLGKVETAGDARDHDFKVFGEGLQGVDRKLEAFREEGVERFDRLDSRVDRLEVA